MALELFAQNSTDIGFRNLRLKKDGTEMATASVVANIYKEDGVAVVGGTSLTASYQSGNSIAGYYIAVVPATANLTPGTMARVVYTITYTDGSIDLRTFWYRVRNTG